jgi:predicted PurR-regulated permease PerM
VIFAVVYQQVENYLIQPQIQKRATKIEAFVVLVAVLFGSTLFGVLGAILAIPAAATIQIAIQEWTAYRRDIAEAEAEAKKKRRRPRKKTGAPKKAGGPAAADAT